MKRTFEVFVNLYENEEYVDSECFRIEAKSLGEIEREELIKKEIDENYETSYSFEIQRVVEIF